MTKGTKIATYCRSLIMKEWRRLQHLLHILFLSFNITNPNSILPACVIPRVIPVYLNSSDVIVSLLRLRLVCFDIVDSQKNQDGQETMGSSPGTEPHIWDQSYRWDGSVLQVKKLWSDREVRSVLYLSLTHTHTHIPHTRLNIMSQGNELCLGTFFFLLL